MSQKAPKHIKHTLGRLSIRHKLFIVTVVLTFITTGAFALVAYKTTTSILHTHLNNHINIVSQNIRTILSMANQNIDNLTMSIMANQDIQFHARSANRHLVDSTDHASGQAPGTGQIENELFKIVLGRHEIEAISLILNNGYRYSLKVNPGIDPTKINANDLKKIRAAKGDLVWLLVDDSSQTIAFGRVYTDTLTLEYIGVMIIHVRKSFFADSLNSLQKQYNESLMLISDEGKTIIRTGQHPSRPDITPDLIDHILKTSSDSFIHDDIAGEAYQIWVLPMPDYQCRLISFVPMSYMVEKTKALKLQMGLIGLICWLEAVIIGLFLSRSITNPISLLLRSIQRLSVDKTLQKVDWSSNDEIGLVVKTYNDMIDNLASTQADLIKREKDYRSIFLNAQEGIFRCDKNGIIQRANPAMAQMFGYDTEDDLIEEGISIRELTVCSYPDRASFPEWVDHLESNMECKLAQQTENHQTRFASLNMVKVMDDETHEPYYDGIVEDITLRKAHEKDKADLQTHILQAQRMESLGTLAGGVAHDFNNILSAIMGYAELAQLSIDKETNAQEYIAQLIRASDRAKSLVQQILIYSRKEKSEKVPTDVSLVIKEALKLIKASIPSTIQLKQSIPAHLGTVLANDTQIHQIVMNLCSNAYHCMAEKGGELNVTLESVHLCPDDADAFVHLDPGRYIQLTVSDTGHGMAPETMQRIFDPYFTTKKVGEGTGMGLSTVMGIVRDHGGDITVHSSPGRGTTFHILLPVTRTASRQTVAASEQYQGGNERILFVDDEEILIETGKKLLTILGYHVETRASGIDALQAFKAHPETYDLVLSDITMPGMTGDKLAREIKKISPSIPIILSSGFSSYIEEDKIASYGINALLMKPYTYLELAKTVRQVLDNV